MRTCYGQILIPSVATDFTVTLGFVSEMIDLLCGTVIYLYNN